MAPTKLPGGFLFYLGIGALLTSTALAENVPFDAQPVGTGVDLPFKLHAADLDGDGDRDIIAGTSSTTQAPVWFENDGGRPATFTERAIDPTFLSGQAVFAADIDGDGDLDVVSAESIDDEIAWFESDGATPPLFTKRAVSTSQSIPTTVIAADLDGDGDMDIAAGSAGDDTINWYDNDGASPPTFAPRTITVLAAQVQEIHAADVDGDGDLDVLSANANSNTLSWYENDGAVPPTFTKIDLPTTHSNPTFIIAADFDRDGDMDVLATWAISNIIAWYENDGDANPSFTERTVTTVSQSPSSVSVADFDCDGDLDVAAPSGADGIAYWFENDGATPPAFTERELEIGLSGPITELAMDFDGDGDADIATSVLSDDTITYYENRFIHSDVVLTNEQTVDDTTTSGPAFVATGDFDGDGNTDFAVSEIFGGSVAWYDNSGFGTFSRRTFPGVGTFLHLEPADLDHDGDLDLLYADSGFDDAGWLENDGASPPTFTDRTIDADVTDISQIAYGDLDGDGDLDVAAAASDGEARWYESDGGAPPSFTPHVATNLITAPGGIAIADFDRDGDLDIVVTDRENEGTDIAWLENDGAADPAFAFHLISDAMTGFGDLTVADLDGDGDGDILPTCLNVDGGWFENDGAAVPAFTFHPIAALRTSRQTYAIDLDKDGDLDIVKASALGGSIDWYENDGQRPVTFVPQSEDIPSSGGQYGIGTAAFGGTGSISAVVSLRDSDEIIILQNVGAQYTVAATALPITGIGEDTTPKAIFSVDITHNGIEGDRELYFKTFGLYFEEAAADPLTSGEFDGLVDALLVRKESGAGIDDIAGNAFIQTYSTFTLVGGSINPGTSIEPNREVAPGATETFYVAIDPTATAAAATPDRLIATWLGAELEVVYSILPAFGVGNVEASASSVADVVTNAIVFGIAPVVNTIALDTTGPVTSGPAEFTVTFSEDVVGFGTEDDLVITETGTATHTGVAITGGPSVYDVNISGLAGEGSLAIAVVPFGDILDTGGIPLESSVTSSALTIDNTAPVITLTGGNLTLECAIDTFSDPGFAASDSLDGNLTADVVVGGDAVDTDSLGVYVITYNVMDDAGNGAIERTRTVTVVDTTPPVITVVGPNPVDVAAGTPYTDLGATALDACAGDRTNAIIVTNPVDTSTAGEYTVTYTVNDGNGNSAMATRTVNVVADSIPGDVNSDGVVNAVDIQLVINAALGVGDPEIDSDINGDDEVNAIDVQLVINAALGI